MIYPVDVFFGDEFAEDIIVKFENVVNTSGVSYETLEILLENMWGYNYNSSVGVFDEETGSYKRLRGIYVAEYFGNKLEYEIESSVPFVMVRTEHTTGIKHGDTIWFSGGMVKKVGGVELDGTGMSKIFIQED